MCGTKAVIWGSEAQCAGYCQRHTGFSCTGYGYRSSDGCHLYKDSSSCGNAPSLNWYTCTQASTSDTPATIFHCSYNSALAGAKAHFRDMTVLGCLKVNCHIKPLERMKVLPCNKMKIVLSFVRDLLETLQKSLYGIYIYIYS